MIWLFVLEALVPMLLFLFLALVDEHNIIMEDQFITLKYSRSLAKGVGLVFNPGERVEGFSNPLWVFLLAPAFLGGLNVLTFNRMLCIIAALAHFPILNSIIRRFNVGNHPRAIALLPAMLLAVSFPFLFWTKSGMETAFASLLLLSGIGLLVAGWPLAGSLALGFLGITRPEGIIYMPLAAVVTKLNGKDNNLNDYLRAILPGIVIFVVYEVFRIAYFDDWLPNSFYAKVSITSINQKWQGLRYYLEWFMSLRGVVLIVAVILLLRKRAILINAAPWVIALFLNAAFIVAVGGDYMPHFRFIVPVLPAAAVVIGLGVMSLCSPGSPKIGLAGRQIISLLVLITALILHPDTGKHLKVIRYAFTRPSDLPVPAPTIGQRWKELWFTRLGQPNRFVGEWIRDNLSPDSTIATDQCGIIPYVSRARTIDIFGLMTPRMAKTPITRRPSLLISMDIEYILLSFSLEPPSPTFLPHLFTRGDFRKRYCLKAILVSQNYRRGSPGYVLFERASDQGQECYHPPLVNSNEEILDWLRRSVKEEPLLACWDYSYDVFR